MAIHQAIHQKTTDGSAAAPQAERTREGWLPADPVPLGLSGFAITTAALSWIMLGIVPKSYTPVVLPLAIMFGGTAQLLAGMWAFAERNAFAAAAFSGYGAFWLSYWLLTSVFLKQIPPAQQAGAQELYLILWGIFTFGFWLASFRVSIAVNLVLALLVPAYVLIGIGTDAASTTLVQIGGGFGLACAVAAGYTALGHVLKGTFGQEVLPLGSL